MIEKIGYDQLLSNKTEAILDSVRFQQINQMGEFPEANYISEELKEQVDDQEIEDMLKEASDPFGDLVEEPQQNNLDIQTIVDGLNHLKLLDHKDELEASKLVNEAMKKKALLNQKLEEEERKREIDQIKKQQQEAFNNQ